MIEMKRKIDKLAQKNYKKFVQALISYETGLEDEQKLDRLYEEFIENDSINLISDTFYKKLESMED